MTRKILFPKQKNGFALVSAIWMAAFVSALAIASLNTTKTEVDAILAYQHQVRSRLLAETGINLAIHSLLTNRGTANHLREHRYDLYGASVTVNIRDEAGKIDLNAANRSLLQQFFASITNDRNNASILTDSLLDWRDKDHARRANGGEAADYLSKDGKSIKNSNLIHVSELYHINNFDTDLIKKIHPHVTVQSGKRGISPQSSTPELLALINNSQITASSEILPRSSKFSKSPSSKEAISRRFLSSDTRSTFNITSSAELGNGSIYTRDVVIRIKGKAYEIYDHRQLIDTQF